MSDTAQRQVLVVEDEPLIRMLAADMLDMLGFGVVEAGDGAEALQASRAAGELHAMLIDLGLPDQPGEQVIRQILAERPNLPVIVATGADASAAAARLSGQGRVSILEKPYQYKDLEQLMASLDAGG